MTADLRLGDCRKRLKEIPDNSVDVVFTDPPYKLTSGGLSGVMTKGIFDPSVYNNGGKLFDVPEFSEWIPLVFNVLKTDSEFYMMVNDKNMQQALNVATGCGFKLHNILVWDRVNQTPNRWYMKQCEFILYFWKGRAKNIRDMGSSALITIHCKMGGRYHPSEKPIELMSLILGNCVDKGGTVLDPFMGSGSTGVSCVKNGFHFIGIESSSEYFEIASNRIRQSEDDARKIPETPKQIGLLEVA